MEQPLVSIIIPTYNREHLLSETLDSIIAQSYTQWECLIIDDGSSDNTEQLIANYYKKDQRFKFYKRPESKPKGANACRNIGLEFCQGTYVVFFDSDDLMTPDHLDIKVNAIIENACDYVITKTQFFNSDIENNRLETNYNFNSEDINAFNYITQAINWLTYDICLKSSLAKNIQFNEHLKAGQEYNYFSKLTLMSSHAVFIKKVVTFRRQHDDSIRGLIRQDSLTETLSFFYTYWHTYLDTLPYSSLRLREILIYKCYKLALKTPYKERQYKRQLNKALFKEFKLKGLLFVLKLKLNRG